MKVHGKPEFLQIYLKYYRPYLRGIDETAFLDVNLYLLHQTDMPVCEIWPANYAAPHFEAPNTIRIPFVTLDPLIQEAFFRARLNTFAHELGHYVHSKFLPVDKITDPLWRQWAALTGYNLDFIGRWHQTAFKKTYYITPTHEDFADNFSLWLRGGLLEMESFYMGLWGQRPPVRKEDLISFRNIINHTGRDGRRVLLEHLAAYNERALIYLGAV
jgi:hypothetical protein